MLEAGDVLLTWSLLRTPISNQSMSAELLSEHRKMYLDYEGPISGHRGRVRRWDWGDFEWLQRTDDRYSVRLRGERLRGTMTLQSTAPGRSWQLMFVSEEATATDDDGSSKMNGTDGADSSG
jgi:hypothetical protein